jgi:predicted GIY-YIG superfamily endonuclease
MQEKTQLYRYYNHNQELLYIGISLNAVARLQGHKRNHDWTPEISFISVTKFQTRYEALAAEELAIKTEKPLHNGTHNYGVLIHEKGLKKDDPMLVTTHQAQITVLQKQRDRLQAMYLQAEQSNIEWRSKFQTLLNTYNQLSTKKKGFFR